ncbi:MAG: integrase core domain-containing protein, partial [Epibacterium sp.]|nr:integrase core domain-containing protein [Epibacterium sp.]
TPPEKRPTVRSHRNHYSLYLHAWETGSEAKTGIRKWIDFYNHKRPHSALGGQPPAVIDRQRNETTQPDQRVQKVA